MTKDYQKSNSITEVGKKRFRHKEFNILINSTDDNKERQINAQVLLDYLCEKFDIPDVRITITDRKQPCRKNKSGHIRSKLYGLYYFGSCHIYIYNKTAIREKVLSINVLTDTILHEFMHHYDVYYLGIKTTPHSEGFFSRINDLRLKLEEK